MANLLPTKLGLTRGTVACFFCGECGAVLGGQGGSLAENRFVANFVQVYRLLISRTVAENSGLLGVY